MEAMRICMLDLSSDKILELKDCYYMPKIIRNIIFISLLLKQGYEIRLMKNRCFIFFSNEFYGNSYIDNNLLILALHKNIFHIERNMKRKREDVNITYLWHCRLGHISESKINKLYKEEFFDPYDYESLKTCECCLMGKMIKTPFSRYGERANELLVLVHTDVCGSMTTQVKKGCSYFIIFIDDVSRFGYVYLMKHKFEAFEIGRAHV